MTPTRPPSLRRAAAGLAAVALPVLLAASCGDFQIAEFTRATTTTIEVEAVPTTIVDPVVGSTETTLADMRYTVEAGDSIGAIAAEFGVPPQVLMDANDITDAASLQEGQELVIPDPDSDVTPPWQMRDEGDAG